MSDQGEAPEFGRYRLLSLLGKGGTARVFRALRPGPMGFGKEVALKIIGNSPDMSEEAALSLVNEARLGCLLRHRNIVSIDEFDRFEDTFYIAMEYIDGWPLEKLLSAQRKLKRPVPLSAVLEALIEICNALEYAHTLTDKAGNPLGIIHRDLKPGNVMVSRNGEVKIADFGTAKAKTNVKETQDGFTRGTPAYMSPEQVTGKKLDSRSDIFSFGALLHELVTLEMVFPGDNLVTVMHAVLEGDLSEARASVAGIAPALEPVLKRCMAHDPTGRYQSAATIAADLRRIQTRVGIRPTVAEWVDMLEDELPVTTTGEFGWEGVPTTRRLPSSRETAARTQLAPTADPAPASQLPTAAMEAFEDAMPPGEVDLRTDVPAPRRDGFGLGRAGPESPGTSRGGSDRSGGGGDLPRDTEAATVAASALKGTPGRPDRLPATPPRCDRPPSSEAGAHPRPRSAPGARIPTRPVDYSAPARNVARRPGRGALQRVFSVVWRVLALYIAVLLFLPAVGGRTGEVVSATRDWQLGWFTGNAAPPPWALMSGPGTARSASFVALPAGKLRMGSTEDKRSGRTRSAIEVPAVQVMSHEVTAAQYRAGCPKEWWRIGCKGWKGPAAFQRGDHPAVLVTWQQASDFCAAHGWRLPTEAEWEYAARGEKARRHPWGSKFAEGSANYCDVGCASQVLAVTRKDDGYPKTAPVGAFPRGATPEGIHDLAGNVAEWTLDCWKDTHAGRDSWQPWDPEACAARVVRGASWRDTVENQVGWRRTKAEPNVPTEKIGFRCVTGADPTDPDAG